MSQLAELSRPFPDSYIKPAPQGKFGDYVPHHTINQRLLEVLGPVDYQVVEVIRGYIPPYTKRNSGEEIRPARDNGIVGCIGRMTAVIDGKTVQVDEIGAEDNPQFSNDAENLKNAASDAYKRCAMRFGVGLHLWAQDTYYLDRSLAKREEQQ